VSSTGGAYRRSLLQLPRESGTLSGQHRYCPKSRFGREAAIRYAWKAAVHREILSGRCRRRTSRSSGDGLVVAKLDRLSRSMLDFTALMAQAQKNQWALVALDCAVDTTTPAGEAMANVLATFAQFERRLIGQRTREALAAKRAQGVRLGRPLRLSSRIRQRIERERAAGRTLAAIADGLNADGIPTAQGGRQWWPSSVRAALCST
jgi:hypothetical protein